MEHRHFPVGIETFSEIIDNKFVYVDKTELIYSLINKGKYYFLSRPRRFGKSLLLSTIRAFFEGRRDLFKGLAITRHEYSWERHPVFHLNFVNANLSSADGLNALIIRHLIDWESEWGITTASDDLSQRFFAVIKHASRPEERLSCSSMNMTRHSSAHSEMRICTTNSEQF